MHENGQIISVQGEHRIRTEQKYDSLGEHQSTALSANSIEESDRCSTDSVSASTSQEGPESLSWTDELFELIKLVPEVAKWQNGLLSTWLVFHQLIVNGKFPLDNIYFPLFLDVVRFFGSSTTSRMRYSKDTKLFWRINFLSHCEQGKRGPSSSLWCCFLWRTRFLFCTYDFPHSGQRCRSTGSFFCGVKVVNRQPVVSTSISAETSITLLSVTADTSICNTKSSNLVSIMSSMT